MLCKPHVLDSCLIVEISSGSFIGFFLLKKEKKRKVVCLLLLIVIILVDFAFLNILHITWDKMIIFVIEYYFFLKKRKLQPRRFLS